MFHAHVYWKYFHAVVSIKFTSSPTVVSFYMYSCVTAGDTLKQRQWYELYFIIYIRIKRRPLKMAEPTVDKCHRHSCPQYGQLCVVLVIVSIIGQQSTPLWIDFHRSINFLLFLVRLCVKNWTPWWQHFICIIFK